MLMSEENGPAPGLFMWPVGSVIVESSSLMRFYSKRREAPHCKGASVTDRKEFCYWMIPVPFVISAIRASGSIFTRRGFGPASSLLMIVSYFCTVASIGSNSFYDSGLKFAAVGLLQVHKVLIYPHVDQVADDPCTGPA